MRKILLYLASGSGRRFGANKLLYPLDGKPMYLWGLETLLDVARQQGDCELIVVSRYPEIRQRAEELGLQAADSPESDKGISYTIRTALAAAGEGEYLLFAAADQPYLTAGSVERLLAQCEADAECACLAWDGRPGNPALFSARLRPELLALTGDTGGRAVLRRHNCVLVPADSPRELEDIDTKASLE